MRKIKPTHSIDTISHYSFLFLLSFLMLVSHCKAIDEIDDAKPRELIGGIVYKIVCLSRVASISAGKISVNELKFADNVLRAQFLDQLKEVKLVRSEGEPFILDMALLFVQTAEGGHVFLVEAVARNYAGSIAKESKDESPPSVGILDVFLDDDRLLILSFDSHGFFIKTIKDVTKNAKRWGATLIPGSWWDVPKAEGRILKFDNDDYRVVLKVKGDLKVLSADLPKDRKGKWFMVEQVKELDVLKLRAGGTDKTDKK